jgi:hypothetical protein
VFVRHKTNAAVNTLAFNSIGSLIALGHNDGSVVLIAVESEGTKCHKVRRQMP